MIPLVAKYKVSHINHNLQLNTFCRLKDWLSVLVGIQDIFAWAAGEMVSLEQVAFPPFSLNLTNG